MSRHWPLADLRVCAPGLELRLPTSDELDALADVAAAGVHDPATMPFLVPWTDAPPAERARGTMLWHWRTLGAWTPQNWSLPLAVFADTPSGRQVVGVQDVKGQDFATRREVDTGSWLGLAHQGRGIGTRMRAAVLHLAFAGLGACFANSGALEYNPRSLRVSEKLGYRPNGIDRVTVRGEAVTEIRLRLDRETWEEHTRQVVGDIRVEGLDAARPLFGL